MLGEQTVKVQLDVDGARTQPPTATKNPSSRNASGTEQQVSSPPRHHSTPDHTLPWWSGVASFRHSEPESGLSPLRDRRTVRHDGDRLGTSGDTVGLIPRRGGFASTRGCPPRCERLRRPCRCCVLTSTTGRARAPFLQGNGCAPDVTFRLCCSAQTRCQGRPMLESNQWPHQDQERGRP